LAGVDFSIPQCIMQRISRTGCDKALRKWLKYGVDFGSPIDVVCGGVVERQEASILRDGMMRRATFYKRRINIYPLRLILGRLLVLLVFG
jgi:hypothetical protein